MSMMNNIEIWVEKNGKKKNTYIQGIISDDIELHLKKLKKICCANGSYNKDANKLHIQGDQVDNIKQYLRTIGINNFLIKIS